VKNIFNVQLSSEEADQKVARFISVALMILLWIGAIAGFILLLESAKRNPERWNNKDFVCLAMFLIPIALIPIQLVRYFRKKPGQK
jgi:hypothetical protein